MTMTGTFDSGMDMSTKRTGAGERASAAVAAPTKEVDGNIRCRSRCRGFACKAGGQEHDGAHRNRTLEWATPEADALLDATDDIIVGTDQERVLAHHRSVIGAAWVSDVARLREVWSAMKGDGPLTSKEASVDAVIARMASRAGMLLPSSLPGEGR